MRPDRNTANTAAAPTRTSTMPPATSALRSSPANRLTRPSFLPEELPRIPLEVADQLAEVGVDVFLDEQRAGGALARAQIADHAVDVVDEVRRLGDRDRALVGERERAIDLVL